MINRNRKLAYGVALAAGVIALGFGQAILQDRAEAQRPMVQAPVFEADPFWPRATGGLLLGQTIGLWADEQDHIWVIHRSSATLHNNEKGAELNPPIAGCCKGAKPVLAFDPEGNLVR